MIRSAIPIGWKWFYCEYKNTIMHAEKRENRPAHVTYLLLWSFCFLDIDPIPKAFIAVMTNQLDCADGPNTPNNGEGPRIDGCRLLTIPGQTNQEQAYRLGC